MIVGERLKMIRKSKEMGQGDIEVKTGLLRCYLSRCENGHTIPSLETLEKWTKALGITMSQLFADDGSNAGALPALKKTNPAELSREAANGLRRIEQAFAQMNPRDIKIVVAMARKFAAKA